MTHRVAVIGILAPLLSLAAGCATPKAVKTEDELSRNVGNEVSLEGRYDVGRAGETLDTGAFTVQLDRSGGATPPVGAVIRATGTVARGAMSLGVFIDELSLRSMRSQKEVEARNVPPTGFVLRKASLEIIDVAPDPKVKK
jgi:hypothetical protein